MVVCSSCNTPNVEGTLFCAECGAYLGDLESNATDPVGIKINDWGGDTADNARPSPSPGSGPLAINLLIGDKQRVVHVALHKPIHVGRLDPGGNVFPEIDLTADGGVELGVSRRHARILKREQRIFVEDLGSSNGTYVNGQKLAPYFPEVLSDGDELRLGKLPIKIVLR